LGVERCGLPADGHRRHRTADGLAFQRESSGGECG
jgi:hypothetical protein